MQQQNEESLNQLVERLATVTERIDALLDEAQDAQWQSAPYPTSREESGIRGKGTTNDPTSAIALDGRRLRLRAAVVAAERELAMLQHGTAKIASRLEGAINAWHGEL